MAGWVKKIWKDRKSEYPTRRKLTKTDGTNEIVTVSREEGQISQEGDAFSAANMNDLETRIGTAFDEVNGNLDTVAMRINCGWQNNKSDDTVTLWNHATIGCTCIYTSANSTSIPSATTEWKNATGLLLKRTAKEGCIVLFGYGTGRIAILSNSNGTWGSWVIK